MTVEEEAGEQALVTDRPPQSAPKKRPGYLRVAEDLRDRIHAGVYPQGARLPSMAELEVRYGFSDAVIRQAIGLLRGEGLVETRRGGGTVVRHRPPVRRIAIDRYRAEATVEPTGSHEPSTSFTHDQKISWSEYRLDRHYERVTADPELAALFKLDPGTELLKRRFVFYAREEPTQISINYLPWNLVADTPVADPDREPWPGGTLAQCAFLGHPITRVEESVGSRMPTYEEVQTLAMAQGIPVLTITRRMISGTTVMEVCRDIAIPADRVVLDYALDL